MVQLSQDLTNSVSNIGGGGTPLPLGAIPACHYLPLPFPEEYRLEKGHNI